MKKTTLVLLLLAVIAPIMSVWAKGEKTYYAAVRAQVAQGCSGYGKVYAGKTNQAGTYESASSTAQNTSSVKEVPTYDFYLFAQPVSEGYEFTGWSTTDGEDPTKTGRDTHSPKTVQKQGVEGGYPTPTVYYAYFKKLPPATITFAAPVNGSYTVNNEAVSAQLVKSNQPVPYSVTLAATPAENFRFGGWYTEKNGEKTIFSTELTVTKKFNEGTTVGALFIPNGFAIYAAVAGKGYNSLSEALSEAESGEAITIFNNVTLSESALVRVGVTLTVSAGVTLTINGTLFVAGTLANAGAIDGSGTLRKISYRIDQGDVITVKTADGKECGAMECSSQDTKMPRYCKTTVTQHSPSVNGTVGCTTSWGVLLNGTTAYAINKQSPKAVKVNVDTATDANNKQSVVNKITSVVENGDVDEVTENKVYVLFDDCSVTKPIDSNKLKNQGVVDCAGKKLSASINSHSSFGMCILNGSVSFAASQWQNAHAAFFNMSSVSLSGIKNTGSTYYFYDCGTALSPCSLSFGYYSDWSGRDGNRSAYFYSGYYCGYEFNETDDTNWTKVYGGAYTSNPYTWLDDKDTLTVSDPEKLGDWTYYIVEKIEKPAEKVVKIGAAEYSSLNEAIANAQNGDTIECIAAVDLTETEVEVPFGLIVTIALDDHGISGGKIVNRGTLTFTDASTGRGKNNTDVSGGTVGSDIDNYGTLDFIFGSYSGTIVNKNGGTLNTHNGMFTGTITKEAGTVNLKGGHFSTDITSLATVNGCRVFEKNNLYSVCEVPNGTMSDTSISGHTGYSVTPYSEGDFALLDTWQDGTTTRTSYLPTDWSRLAELVSFYQLFNNNGLDATLAFDRGVEPKAIRFYTISNYNRPIEAALVAGSLYRGLSEVMISYGKASKTYNAILEEDIKSVSLAIADESNMKTNAGTVCLAMIELWSDERATDYSSTGRKVTNTVYVAGQKLFTIGAGSLPAMIRPATGAATFYATLGAAMDAAANGGTVMLANDCTTALPLNKVGTYTFDTMGFAHSDEYSLGEGLVLKSVTDVNSSAKVLVADAVAKKYVVARKIAVPTAVAGLVYDGTEKTGVAAGTGYTLSDVAAATAAGSYTATATLEANYVWSDDSTGTKTIEWSIATKPATITVTSASKVYGEADPVFTGTVEGLVNANDLGTVTYVRTGADASVGTYNDVLTANYTPNSNYAVTVVPAAFTITRKGVTVTVADDYAKTYGEDDPIFEATVEGLTGSGTIEYAISREEGENVGEYVVTPAGEAVQGNYSVNYVPGKLTINKASLTATAENKTVVRGETVEYTIAYSGFVNGDSAASITAPTARCDYDPADHASAVTSYPITLSGGAADNYSITLVNGTLTVDPCVATAAPEGTTRYFKSLADAVAAANGTVVTLVAATDETITLATSQSFTLNKNGIEFADAKVGTAAEDWIVKVESVTGGTRYTAVKAVAQDGDSHQYASINEAVEHQSGDTISVTVVSDTDESVELGAGTTLTVTVADGVTANVTVAPETGAFLETAAEGTTTTYVSKKITVEMAEPSAVEVSKIEGGATNEVSDAEQIAAAVALLTGNKDVPRTDNTDKLDVLDVITVTPTKIVEDVTSGTMIIRSATFDVVPHLNDGQSLAEGQKLKFRLPVDAAATQLAAIVYHGDAQFGIYPVQTYNDEKYVEVESDTFSPYGYELLDGETANPIAAIGTTGYATLDAALAAASNGDTIYVFAGTFDIGSDTIVVNKEVTITGAGKDATTLNFTANGKAAFSIQASNVTIEDMTINQADTSTDNTHHISIVAAGSDACYSNVTISNLKLGGGKYSMIVYGESFTIDGCDFASQGSSQILVDATKGDSRITNNTFTGGKYNVLQRNSHSPTTVTSSGKLTISNNTSQNGNLLYILESASSIDTTQKMELEIVGNEVANYTNKAVALTPTDELGKYCSAVTITNNAFHTTTANRPVIQRDDAERSSLEINASANYWGSATPDFTNPIQEGGSKYLIMPHTDSNNIVVNSYGTAYTPNTSSPGATVNDLLYKVTFVDEDGTTVLYETNVASGNAPVYGGTTPAKAATEQYTYTWTGWTYGGNTYGTSDTLASVSAAQTYTATYSSSVNSYTVTVTVPANSTITVKQNGTAIQPDTGTDNEFTVPYGTELTVEYAASGAYIAGGTQSQTVTADSTKTVAAPNDYTTTAAVAQIGSAYYPSLAAAVAAASAGDTITMLADDRVSLTASYDSEIAITKPLTITGPVDSNGDPLYTIYGCTSAASGHYNDIFVSSQSGTVTISNVALAQFGSEATTSYNDYSCPIFVSGSNNSVVLDNLSISEFNRTAIHINGGEFLVTNCYIDCATTMANYRIGGIQIVNDATGSIIDTTIVNVDTSDPSVSVSAGLEIIGSGAISVEGCTISSAINGIWVSTAEGTAAGSSAVTVADTTVSADMYSLANDSDNGGTLSVSSGNYEGMLVSDAEGGLAISGGTFDDEIPEEYCASGYIPTAADPVTGLYTVEAGYKVTFVNYDGTTELFTTNVAVGGTAVYEGDTPVKPSDASNVYTFSGWDPVISAVTDAAQTYTAQYTSATPKFSLTVNNETTYYATLADAVNAAPTDGTAATVTALGAYEVAGFTTKAGQNIAFTPNGNRVNLSTPAMVVAGSTVTMNASGMLGINGNDATAALIENYGTLNLSGAQIMGKVTTYDGGTLNVTKGTLYMTLVGEEGATVNIAGNTSSPRFTAGYGQVVAKSGSSFTITGGDMRNDLVVEDGANISISGGYFKTKLENAWCATGYVPTIRSALTGTSPYGVVVADDAWAKLVTSDGGEYYYTQYMVGTALNNYSSDGDTIVLLKDHSAKSFSINNTGKALTIDLNGYSLKAVTMWYGDVTITNGTIVQDIDLYPQVQNSGKVSNLTIANGCTVTDGIVLWPEDDNDTGTGYDANLTVYGTVNNGIFVSGNLHEGNSTITIKNGGVVTDTTGPAIAMNGYAIVNVEEGATVTGTTGIEVRAGELNVTGGTITGTAATATNQAQDSGSATSGAGIAVAQHTTALPIAVSITGGDISGAEALYVVNPQGNTSDDEITVTIAPGESTTPKLTGGLTVSDTRADVAISGGNFSVEVPEELCAEGYIPSPDTTVIGGVTYYTVKTGAFVARNVDTGVGYETLEGAISDATAGDTIKLLADITNVTESVAIDKALTLDGDGHAITAAPVPADGHRNMFSLWGGGTAMLKAETGAVTIRNITLDGDVTHRFTFLVSADNASVSLTTENVRLLHGGEISVDSNSATITPGNGYGAAIHLNNGAHLVVSNGFYACTGTNVNGVTTGIFPFTAILPENLAAGTSVSFELTGDPNDPANVDIGEDLLLVGMEGDLIDAYGLDGVQDMLDFMKVPSRFIPYTLTLGDGSTYSFTGASPRTWNEIIDYGKDIMDVATENGFNGLDKDTTPVEVGLAVDTVIPGVFTFADTNFTVNGNGNALSGTIKYTDNAGLIEDIVLGTEDNPLVLDLTDVTQPIEIGSGISVSNVTIQMTAERATAGTPVIIWDAAHGVDAPENEAGVSVVLVDDQGQPTSDMAELIWDDEMGLAYIGPAEARLTGPTHETPIYTTLANAIAWAEQTGDTVTLMTNIVNFTGTQAITKQDLVIDGAGYSITAAPVSTHRDVVNAWAGSTAMFKLETGDVTFRNITLDGDATHAYTFLISADNSSITLTTENVRLLNGGELCGDANGAIVEQGAGYGAAVHLNNGAHMVVSNGFYACTGGKTAGCFPFTGILVDTNGGDVKFKLTGNPNDPENVDIGGDLLLVGMPGVIPLDQTQDMLDYMKVPTRFIPYTLTLGDGSAYAFTGASPLGWNDIINYGKEIMDVSTAIGYQGLDKISTPVEVGLLTDTVLPDTFRFADTNFTVNGNGNALAGTIEYTDNAGLIHDIVLGTEGNALVLDMTETTKPIVLGSGISVTNVTIEMTAEQATAGTPVIIWDAAHGVDAPANEAGVTVQIVDDQGESTGVTKELIWDDEMGLAYIGPVEARLTGPTHDKPIYTTLADAIAGAEQSGDTVTLMTNIVDFTGSQMIVKTDLVLDGAGHTITAAPVTDYPDFFAAYSGEPMLKLGSGAITLKNITLDGGATHAYTYLVSADNDSVSLTTENITLLHGGAQSLDTDGNPTPGVGYGAAIHLNNGAELIVKDGFYADTHGAPAEAGQTIAKADGIFPFTAILPEGGSAVSFDLTEDTDANPTVSIGEDLLLVGMLGAIPHDQMQGILDYMKVPTRFIPYTLTIADGASYAFTGGSPRRWNDIIDYGKEIMDAATATGFDGLNKDATPVEVGLLVDTILPAGAVGDGYDFLYEDSNFSINGNGNALSGTIKFTDDADGGLMEDITLGTQDNPLTLDLSETDKPVDLGDGVVIQDVVVLMTEDQATLGKVVFDWDVTGEYPPDDEQGVTVTVVDSSGEPTGEEKGLVWDEEYGVAYIGPVEARLTGLTHETPVYTSLANALDIAKDNDKVELLTNAVLSAVQGVGSDVTLDLAGYKVSVNGEKGLFVTNATLVIADTSVKTNGTICAGDEASPASLIESGNGGVVNIPTGIFAAASGQNVLVTSDNGAFAVSGGYFSNPVLPEHCAPGYAPIEAPAGAPQQYTVGETVPEFRYPIDGTAGVPVTNTWLATYMSDIYDDPTKPIFANITNDLVQALSVDGANGIPRWESYVLGFDPTDPKAQLRLTATSKDAATVTITGLIDMTKFPEIENVAVTFRLAEQNSDKWTDVDGCTGSDVPSFTRPLEGVADKVLRIFADIEVEAVAK